MQAVEEGVRQRHAWAQRGDRRAGVSTCRGVPPAHSWQQEGLGRERTALLPSGRRSQSVRPLLPPLDVGNTAINLPSISILPLPPRLPPESGSEDQGPQLPGGRSYLP